MIPLFSGLEIYFDAKGVYATLRSSPDSSFKLLAFLGNGGE